MELKTCSNCKVTKPKSEFWIARKNKYGLMGTCKSCSSLKRAEWHKNNPEKARAQGRKWRKNNIEKCRTHNRNWARNNPEKARASVKNAVAKRPEYHKAMQRRGRIKRDYGIEHSTYLQMNQDQGSRCAICDSSVPGKGRNEFCIDHDHSTGYVRGLLCFNCNVLLGTARDRIDVLSNAIAYLEASAQRQAILVMRQTQCVEGIEEVFA